MKMTICRQIALSFNSFVACDVADNKEWRERHKNDIVELCKNGPSGAGIDNGTHFNFEESKLERLVLDTSYHHMNEHGYYDGWTHHQIIVIPSLIYDFDIRVTGCDRRDIKEHLAEVYSHWLSTEVDS